MNISSPTCPTTLMAAINIVLLASLICAGIKLNFKQSVLLTSNFCGGYTGKAHIILMTRIIAFSMVSQQVFMH